MTHRMKFWLGVSTAALLSGALPVVPTVIAGAVAPVLGTGLLVHEVEAQESGEEGGETECTTEESQGEEGEEGGASECPKPEGEGEEGEGS